MTNAYHPADHPALTSLLRWIADLMCLSALCARAKCRRAGRCRGEPRACLARCAPLVPEDAREGVKAMIEGRERGLTFDDLREEEPAVDDLLAWQSLVQACRGREAERHRLPSGAVPD
jgi:hypothetical protein